MHCYVQRNFFYIIKLSSAVLVLEKEYHIENSVRLGHVTSKHTTHTQCEKCFILI